MESGMMMPPRVPVRKIEVKTREHVPTSLSASHAQFKGSKVIEAIASPEHRRRLPIDENRKLERACLVSISVKSQLNNDKLVKCGADRNRIAQEFSSDNSEVRSCLDAFPIKGTKTLLKEQFARKL